VFNVRPRLGVEALKHQRALGPQRVLRAAHDQLRARGRPQRPRIASGPHQHEGPVGRERRPAV